MFRFIMYVDINRLGADRAKRILSPESPTWEECCKFAEQLVTTMNGPLYVCGYHIEQCVPDIGWVETNEDPSKESTDEE